MGGKSHKDDLSSVKMARETDNHSHKDEFIFSVHTIGSQIAPQNKISTVKGRVTSVFSSVSFLTGCESCHDDIPHVDSKNRKRAVSRPVHYGEVTGIKVQSETYLKRANYL